MGLETHLWYIGDPDLPGHEKSERLHLHRWCQWLSNYHRRGVYDGEEAKHSDYSRSLPSFLLERVLLPQLYRTNGRALVLGEEWHTADAILELDRQLRATGIRDRVEILWNANNTFGFDRIPWRALARAAALTTVSRYMRYRMWEHGVDPLVVANGLSPCDLELPDADALASFRATLSKRLVLVKVARWDPDKRWLLAVDIVAELKRRGKCPLLIARGGVEAHREEVLARAKARGLTVAERMLRASATDGLLEAMDGLNKVDIVTLGMPLDRSRRRLLYRGADAVLANSAHEPFGLVGLESMAVGGLACTGGTGEDYAIPNWNALVVQSNDPMEFITLFEQLQARPDHLRAIRRHAQTTASGYCWSAIVRENLLARLDLLRPYARVVLPLGRM
jgi:glycosyltransferase involved in cell wall biosynthesis